jgi:methionine-rich copper-binding protein CopC
MKIIALVSLGLALAGAPAAFAHAKLVSADPADGGAAPVGLAKLRLGFSEPIAVKLSGVSVTDPAGKILAASAMADPGDAKTLVVAIKSPLKAGAYKVAWRAVASDDGHRTTGLYSFVVK